MSDRRLRLSSGREDLRRRTPWESLFFAYAAMAPLAFATVAFFLSHGDVATFVARLAVVWAAAILCFLAGVRRGLSFRQEGGPLLSQLATMLGLFALGFAALASPSAPASLALLIVGYAAMAIYDPIAARQGEAPNYFQRLRPAQMTIAVVSLALILAGLVLRA